MACLGIIREYPVELFAQHLGEERTSPCRDYASIIITQKEFLFESSLEISRARVEGRGDIINGISSWGVGLGGCFTTGSSQRKNHCVLVVVTKAADVLTGENLVGDVNFSGLTGSTIQQYFN